MKVIKIIVCLIGVALLAQTFLSACPVCLKPNQDDYLQAQEEDEEYWEEEFYGEMDDE